MKIALLQFAPLIGERTKNEQKADLMLEKFTIKDGVDLLILPEMIFTGYVFSGKEHIYPYLEDEKGPTFQWCSKQAKRLNCYVAAGYPQIVKKGAEEKFYNSQCIVAPNGELVKTYHKTFLYETDETWAEEGHSFECIEIPELGIQKAGLGICMDINPRQFKAPFEAFEFGNFHKTNNVQLIIFSSNWLDQEPEDNDNSSLINYLATRLRPLIKSKVYFAFANRTGTENGIRFIGSSFVLSLNEPALVAKLSKTDENVLIANIPDLGKRQIHK